MSGGWWVHDLWNAGRATELVAWIFWVLASISLHELAHGWAAIWEGDDTPRVTGRMTANPVVHMGIPSIAVFFIIGLAWGMMPVNPYRFRHGKWGRILVSAAGPFMNLALAFVTLTALGILASQTGENENMHHLMIFLFTGGFLNFVLFAFNLLPIPPLDGSTILANLFPEIGKLYSKPQAPMVGMFLMLMLVMSNAGSAAFLWANNIATAYSGLVASLFS
ncbi:MAG: site-2 protease family protein [Phycisphaerales bacterium]|jgi:Zn-dependent protease|nr:site-2 protease family protein [Phycisphaerales bacterium]